MRCLLVLMIVLFAETCALAATQFASNLRPVYLGYNARGTSVASPNGEFQIVITGPKESFAAWVTVKEPSTGWLIQVWPIERNVKVLWRPDSQAFALTDDRYANESYVLVFGTKFHMSGPILGVPRDDITPLLKKTFVSRAREYYLKHYGSPNYESDSFYAKALAWMGNNHLLVGVFSITNAPMPRHQLGTAPGVRGWCFGYVVDTSQNKILRVLGKKAVHTQFGFKCLPED